MGILDWKKGCLIGFGLGVLAYLYQLTRVLYNNWTFSSMDNEMGYVMFYDFPNIWLNLVLILFLTGISGLIWWLIYNKRN